MPPVVREKSFLAKQMILKRTQHQFRRACDQIVLLNQKMEFVLHRYHRARDIGARSFRYKLRLRLAVVEGVRNMFYEYANRKALNIVNLRRSLFGEIVEIVTDDDYEDVVDMEADDSILEEDSDSQSDIISESEAEMNEIL